MRLFWFMFFSNLLMPVIFIVAGRFMWKHCPKEINGLIGYRTKRSMKNLDTWRFAHDYCGHLWWKIGWIMLPLSILVQIPFYNSHNNAIPIYGVMILAVQGMVLIASIFPTENALKKRFYEDGTRR